MVLEYRKSMLCLRRYQFKFNKIYLNDKKNMVRKRNAIDYRKHHTLWCSRMQHLVSSVIEAIENNWTSLCDCDTYVANSAHKSVRIEDSFRDIMLVITVSAVDSLWWPWHLYSTKWKISMNKVVSSLKPLYCSAIN